LHDESLLAKCMAVPCFSSRALHIAYACIDSAIGGVFMEMPGFFDSESFSLLTFSFPFTAQDDEGQKAIQKEQPGGDDFPYRPPFCGRALWRSGLGWLLFFCWCLFLISQPLFQKPDGSVLPSAVHLRRGRETGVNSFSGVLICPSIYIPYTIAGKQDIIPSDEKIFHTNRAGERNGFIFADFSTHGLHREKIWRGIAEWAYNTK